jgi:hypothetical protein
MFDLGHDAKFTWEEGEVTIVASTAYGGRAEDKSHGVPTRVAKMTVPHGDVNRS